MSRSPDEVYYGYISSNYEGALGPLKPSKFCQVILLIGREKEDVTQRYFVRSWETLQYTKSIFK
jgi:hypothetical protein